MRKKPKGFEAFDSLARKLVKVNPADVEARNLKSLLIAAKEALRVMELAREILDEGGGTGDRREVCAEAKLLTPAIRKLRNAINGAENLK